MGLYTRLGTTGSGQIGAHRFGAALRQWAAGEITRAQVITSFSLTGSDVTELDALAATYNAMGVGTVQEAFAKAAWLHRMEDVFVLCATGDYTEAKAKTALGF